MSNSQKLLRFLSQKIPFRNDNFFRRIFHKTPKRNQLFAFSTPQVSAKIKRGELGGPGSPGDKGYGRRGDMAFITAIEMDKSQIQGRKKTTTLPDSTARS